MRKKSLECRNVLLVVSLILAAVKASAQFALPPLVSALPEEAPVSLFSAEIGGSDIELFVQGFWEASLLSSGLLSFGGPSAGTFNATPLLLTQRPDLYLLLVFRKQWWLEVSVADDIERATWALGYTGEDDDFVDYARLGNTGILMPDYPFMNFGAPSGAFGAVVAGRDEARGTAFDAMLRWDGLSWQSRSFSGLAETVETLVRPRDHLRGRRFVLPDAELTSIALYDHTTSGKRLLQADEYTFSRALRFVELKAEPEGVLSVVYSTAGGPQPELGLYQKAGTEVNSSIEITAVGTLSEARNLYALSDSTSNRELFVRNLASGLIDTGFEVRQAGSGMVEVVRAGVAGPWPDSSMYKRPFSVEAAELTINPDAYGQDWIYEDDIDSLYPPNEGFVIVARSTEAVDSIVLGKDTVPGTVTVFRDGVQSQSFEYDPTDGSLDLYPPPRSGESIIIRYAVTSADRTDGALVFAAGTRFPWLGLDWALALGGRWSLPGVAYASNGELKPAWTGLAVSLEHRESDFGYGVKTMARYSRASANGLYRLVGMDEEPAYTAPFRPIDGDIGGIDIATALDLTLTEAFPETMDKIHSQNEMNRVLAIKANADVSSGDIDLIRYIDPAPLASFSRLSFFIKKSEDVSPTLDGTTQLSLQVGNGVSGAGGLTIDLPLGELPSEWLKLEVDLDPVITTVRLISSDGQSLNMPLGYGVDFYPVSTVGQIHIIVSDLAAGTVYIDEIVLEEPADGLSAILAMDFFLGQIDSSRPPYFGIEMTGLADENLSLGGSVRAGWLLGPSEWALSLAPVWSNDYQSAAYGYILAIPNQSATTRYVDQYSQNISDQSFSRGFLAALALGELQVGLKTDMQDAGEQFSWAGQGSVGLGTIAIFGLDLGMLVPVSLTKDLEPLDIWLESWELAIPSRQSEASSRRLGLSLDLLESRFAFDCSQNFTAPVNLSTKAGIKTSIPFTVDAFKLEPFLERRYTLSGSGNVTGFSDDISFAFDRAKSMQRVFLTIPIIDLFTEDLSRRFVESVSGSDSASYSTGAGISVSRPIGYGLVDFVVPNNIFFLWNRTLEVKLDSQAEFHDFTFKTTTAAVNLFGYGGIKPVFKDVAYDEYASSLEAAIRYHPADGAILPAFLAKYAVSAETRNDVSLAANSSFSWKNTRTGYDASEALSLSLSTKPARTWLGDLVNQVYIKRSTVSNTVSDVERAGLDSSEKTGSSVSRWLDSILIETLVLREAFDATLTWSGKDLPGSTALKTSLAYSTRIIIPGRLSVGFSSSLSPSINFRTDGWVWGFGYEFVLDGRVSF